MQCNSTTYSGFTRSGGRFKTIAPPRRQEQDIPVRNLRRAYSDTSSSASTSEEPQGSETSAPAFLSFGFYLSQFLCVYLFPQYLVGLAISCVITCSLGPIVKWLPAALLVGALFYFT